MQVKTVAEMLGEAFREAGILLIVFTPLYVVFDHSTGSTETVLWVGIGAGVISFSSGILVEVFRGLKTG